MSDLRVAEDELILQKPSEVLPDEVRGRSMLAYGGDIVPG